MYVNPGSFSSPTFCSSTICILVASNSQKQKSVGLCKIFLSYSPQLSYSLELALTLLLERFKFSPSQEIGWHMAGVVSPYVIGSEDASPRLPMKLTLVQPEVKVN